MTTLREAAQQALEAFRMCVPMDGKHAEADAAFRNLRAALAQQDEPVEPVAEFDHGIGADRFKVVRGAYWWHILIGDSPIKRGKFHTKAGAEEMIVLLLREFRNGAFVQYEAALAQQEEPVEPVAWINALKDAFFEGFTSVATYNDTLLNSPEEAWGNYKPPRAAPPQRKPLTDEEILRIFRRAPICSTFARAIERAHGIGATE